MGLDIVQLRNQAIEPGPANRLCNQARSTQFGFANAFHQKVARHKKVLPPALQVDEATVFCFAPHVVFVSRSVAHQHIGWFVDEQGEVQGPIDILLYRFSETIRWQPFLNGLVDLGLNF
jgi:hypothetical protein